MNLEMAEGSVGAGRKRDARVGAGSRGRRVCHKNEVSKDMEDVPYYGKGES